MVKIEITKEPIQCVCGKTTTKQMVWVLDNRPNQEIPLCDDCETSLVNKIEQLKAYRN